MRSPNGSSDKRQATQAPASVTSPRVSVIVPVHNVERYIGAAIDSLLEQTYTDFEVVVVDDGSQDRTVEIVQNYEDPRVRLVRHARNMGVAQARNTGLECSRGELIALLDGDDIALPDRLERQVSALDAAPEIGMVGCYSEGIDEAGILIGVVWKRPVSSDGTEIGLLFRNTLGGSPVMFRRSAIPENGYRQFPVAEDYDFNARLAKRWKVTNVPRALIRYRVRRDGLTQTNKDLMETHVRQVMREQLEDLGIQPTARELDLNRHIGALILPNTHELLDEIEAWLLKIQKANDAIRRYDSNALARVLAHEWFEVCKFASELGWVAWRRHARSALRGAWEPPWRQKIRFAAKCLVRHRRKGGDIPLPNRAKS